MEVITTNITWKNKIIELNKQGFTNKEIAEKLNTSPRHIQKLSNRYKIKANKFRQIQVDDELEQFFLGSFLGDGSFRKSAKASTNANLIISHGEKQTDYLNWKYSFLQSKLITCNLRYYTVTDNRIKKGKYTTGFLKTESNPIFNKYCDQYKPNKQIQYDFVKLLTPFGLAVWFMDDGFVTKNSFQISSCSFSKEEITILRQVLKENFNIETNMNQVNEIYIKTQSKNNFLKLVTPYIIPSLKYKLIPYADRVHVKQGELLEHPNKDNQQPSLDSNVFEGSTTNNRVLPDNTGDSNVDTSTLH